MSDYDELANGEAEYSHVELLGETDKAWHLRQNLVCDAPTDSCWIPKSQGVIERMPEMSLYTMTVASWFARKHLEPYGWVWNWVDDLHEDFDRNMEKDD